MFDSNSENLGNKRIGFMLFDYFTYHVYKHVFSNIPGAEFILGELRGSLLIDKKTEKQRVLGIKSLADFLESRKLPYRIFDPSWPEKKLSNFFSGYEVLVSLWFTNTLFSDFLSETKKVRMLYGNAKDIWNFGLWSAFFDLVLSYGPYSQKHLEIYGNAKEIGNPRFDHWFGADMTEEDKKDLELIRSRIDARKKTILYLPTHGELSSYELFVKNCRPVISALSEEFNFIIKPHYHLTTDIAGLDDKLKNLGVISFFDRELDPVNLFHFADVVLSDNSGAIFDAVLADKPLVLWDSIEDKASLTRQAYITPRGIRGFMTYSGSLEQKIKTEGRLAPVIHEFNELPSALRDAEEKEPLFSAERKKIREEVFCCRDGKAGERAAAAIQNLAAGRKPPKNFLYYVILSGKLGYLLEQKIVPTSDLKNYFKIITFK